MLTNSAYGSARIKRIRTDRIQTELDARKIVLVAGFQGINKYDDITTLGRGGSDTSAVALAASLHADLCQIYTDVDGVYTADPRSVTGARKLEEITYDEMLARHLMVMDSTATSLSMDNHIPIVLFALKDPENIYRVIMGEKIGTIVKEEL